MKCLSRCSSGEWGKYDWDMSDLGKGFMYCCEMSDFAAAVPYAPDLKDEEGNWPAFLDGNAGQSP